MALSASSQVWVVLTYTGADEKKVGWYDEKSEGKINIFHTA